MPNTLDQWQARGHVTAETTSFCNDYFAAIQGLEARDAKKMAEDNDMEVLTRPQIRAALGRSAFELILRLATLHKDDASTPIRDAAEQFVRAEVLAARLSCPERIDIAVVATRLEFWADIAGDVKGGRRGQDGGGTFMAAADAPRLPVPKTS